MGLKRGPRIAVKSCSSSSGGKNLCFQAVEGIWLFIICCRAKAFLQLGPGDNQHSFLSQARSAKQTRFSSSSPPTPSALGPQPGLPFSASVSKKAKEAFKSKKARIPWLRDEGKDCDPLADGFA